MQQRWGERCLAEASGFKQTGLTLPILSKCREWRRRVLEMLLSSEGYFMLLQTRKKIFCRNSSLNNIMNPPIPWFSLLAPCATSQWYLSPTL